MRKIAIGLCLALSLLLLVGGIGGIILYQYGFFAPPNLSLLDKFLEKSKMYDDAGNLIGEYCEYCRESLRLEDMGDLPRLAVAAEDEDFWTRWTPLSARGMARAFWEDLKSGRLNQGGSTITQQLRIIFLQDELLAEQREHTLRAKLWRKGREFWIAWQIERILPRKTILELYLNSVYCGHNQYGVQVASRYYFGKDVRELSTDEAAMIVGLFRSPATSPVGNPPAARDLRNRVLKQLARKGAISAAEEQKLASRPLVAVRHSNDGGPNGHFTEYVRRQIVAENRLVDWGLRVHTTLNREWQEAAAFALRQSMAAMKKRNPETARDLRGAAVFLDARTGAVKAWAQEPAFAENEYLLDQLERQTGSAFKPFFLAAWVAKGGRLACDDEGSGPCLLDDSYNRGDGRSGLAVRTGNGRLHYIMNFPYLSQARYRGLIPVIEAIAESRNAAVMSGMEGVRNSRAGAFLESGRYVRLTKEEVLGMAMRLGIQKPRVDPGLTIPIGSIETSPLQMARAWTGFLGNNVRPYAIQAIYDRNGGTVFSARPEPKKVLDERTHLQVIRGMRATVEFPHGTGQGIRRELDFQVCGKTGTATNAQGQATDNWFCGATPSYVMVIWIGRDKKLPLGAPNRLPETGGRNCLPVFVATMKMVYKDRPREIFPDQTDPWKPFRYYTAPTQPQTQLEEILK